MIIKGDSKTQNGIFPCKIALVLMFTYTL